MKKIIESLKEKLTYYDLNKYIKPLIVIGIGVFFASFTVIRRSGYVPPEPITASDSIFYIISRSFMFVGFIWLFFFTRDEYK